MKLNSIKCEVINVKTDSGVCIGIAKTKIGEEYIIDGRTPESDGICSNAFCALSNTAFVMMTTKSLPGEKEGMRRQITCPHGVVTFKLSRSQKNKAKAYNQK
jgi:uncharacterized repeat protein (TIGR04076 family)